MNKTIIARTAAEMEEIGADLAPMLADGAVISLIGPLGSGKDNPGQGSRTWLLVTDIVISPATSWHASTREGYRCITSMRTGYRP